MNIDHMKDEQPDDVVDTRPRKYEDFFWDEQQNAFWDIVTKELKTAMSVNGAIPKDQHVTREWKNTGKLKPVNPSITILEDGSGQKVENATWYPGKPDIVEDLQPTSGGFKFKKGYLCINLYDPPERPAMPIGITEQPWVDHLLKLWTPEEVSHFIKFAAHALQFPSVKVNHSIVLAGVQGLGKDLTMKPIRESVGKGNAQEIQPDDIMGKFNGFAKAVLLVVNEVRASEATSIEFYERCKILTAEASDVISIEEKYRNPIHIPNIVRVVMTTNNPMAMFIPEDDRRIFMMWSFIERPFSASYFDALAKYYDSGGVSAVINYLWDYDLSAFNPKARPPMTAGKAAVQAKTETVNEDEFDELLMTYIDQVYGGESPDVIFPMDLISFIDYWAFDDKDAMRKKVKSKALAHRLNRYGYLPLSPPETKEWAHPTFRSRKAYVKQGLGEGAGVNAAKSALKLRPLTFLEERKH